LQLNVKSAKAHSRHAIGRDFCHIFAAQVDELYVWAFLLTGNGSKAEQCFLGAFDDCSRATGVFKDFAQSYARRAVILNAIRLMQPGRDIPVYDLSAARQTDARVENGTPFAAIMALSTFERFVFVLSVLEHIPEQECKALLVCSRSELVAARSRALQGIAQWEERPVTHLHEPQDRFLAQAS
jgi:hypothetical protein